MATATTAAIVGSLEGRIAAAGRRWEVIEQRIAALQKGQRTQNSNNQATSAASAAATVASKKAAAGPMPAHLTTPCARDTPPVAALRQLLVRLGLASAVVQWVPPEYYQRPLAWRRDILSSRACAEDGSGVCCCNSPKSSGLSYETPSIHYLCKSILLENTHCSDVPAFDPTAAPAAQTGDPFTFQGDALTFGPKHNSRYYMVVYQYTEKFDSEAIMRFIKDLNPGMGKKKFNFRLANPAVSDAITGYGFNGVVPFGPRTTSAGTDGTVENRIPIILSQKITQLAPSFFWMGGGHADAKLRVDVNEFVSTLDPYVVDFTTPLTPEELLLITD